MRALSVIPCQANSADLMDVSAPAPADGALLVEALDIGICGTDIEIIAGKYGWAPPGSERLIIGHESIGRVMEAPSDSDFARGDLVVGIVRRPDPVPCQYCAVGEWDMCANGRYTERGIKERDGYAAERFQLEPAFAIKIAPDLGRLGVLLEPTSVVSKAWEHVDRIGRRAEAWQPRSALVTGAGPIGLLAAMIGRLRGLDVHVFDRVTSGPKPQLVCDLGAEYHGGDTSTLDHLAPDVVIECTGAAEVITDVLSRSAASGIICLAGVTSGGHTIKLDLGAINREMVLENHVIVGSVNANRRHYQQAADTLAKADKTWLRRLITRRVPLDRWRDILEHRADDVKVTLVFQDGNS
jgi:glucose 1-dehydrogenase